MNNVSNPAQPDQCPPWCDGHPDGGLIDEHIGLRAEILPDGPDTIRRILVSLVAPSADVEPWIVIGELFPGSLHPDGQAIALSLWQAGQVEATISDTRHAIGRAS